jgi:predicted dehydrogenase
MSDLSAPIGVALLGTGFGVKVLLPAFQDCPQTQVVALYHRDAAKAEAIAQQHGIPQASDSLAQLLDRPDVHGACVATPPFLHYGMAQQVLTAGKHLFLEKPATLTVAEAKALYHLARQARVQTTLDFEFRYVPAWMTLKALVEDYYIGQPRLICINWLVPGRADPDRPWSWHASAAAGGGSLGALGSHTFDYIAWLFGPVKQLCGRLVTAVGYRPDPITGMPKVADADDTCILMLELTDGTPVQVNISAAAYNGRGHWVEVYGDRGTLVLGSDHPSDYVHGFTLRGSLKGEPLTELPILPEYAFRKTHPDGRIAPVTRVIHHWAGCIDREQSAAPSLREGVYTQLLMELTRESHETGCWVSVPDFDEFLSQGSLT